MKKYHLLILFTAALLIAACEPKPQPITIGHDECAHCRMIISEKPFGSQIVSTTGKTWFFDSIECMAAYEIAGSVEQSRIHSRWAPDFINHDEWLAADDAWFLYSRQLRSPMGLHLTAYSNQENVREFQQEYTGEILRWAEVMQLVQREWFD